MNMDVQLNKDSVSTSVDIITSMQKALEGVFWYIIIQYLSDSK